MLNTLKQIWNDERGFVNSMELILIAVLAVLGLIVGLATLRDSVTQELADTGAAVGQFNQSYSVLVNGNGILPENGPQILSAGAGGTVTVNRNFQQQIAPPGDPPTTIVSVTSTFSNFEYIDNLDLGDGQDTGVNTPPPGIMSMTVAPEAEGP
ncbi:hypothetical protein AB1K70_01945 [Bremerella sp. JC770]|uniref:Flp family type IVb pilin n=1 Tax=Bremerella sp. JC770 TaxID=3232137 RepID=UPI0034597F93